MISFVFCDYFSATPEYLKDGPSIYGLRRLFRYNIIFSKYYKVVANFVGLRIVWQEAAKIVGAMQLESCSEAASRI